jgi:ketosteroid isomerase-like protein
MSRDREETMRPANVDAVRMSLEAWNRGDVDGWLDASHPDIEWISEIAQALEGSHKVYRGREEMREYWDEWHELWKVTIEITEIRELGDKVVALARVRAQGATSGIDLDRQIAYLFEFEEGLARRVRSYFDTERALEAAGMTH